MIVTNVPGSPYQLYMCGAQIVDSFGIGPVGPGLGLFHTVNSAVNNKKGKISIAFVACRDVMPDPAFYAECLQASFTELRQAFAMQVGRRQRRGDGTISVEGNHYFPPESVRQDVFSATDKTTVCPWKGTASYFSLQVEDAVNTDAKCPSYFCVVPSSRN